MSGFFARIIAQVAIVGVQVLTKAFAQALQRAQAGGGANAAASAARSAVMGSRMSVEQARAVLNVGEKGAYAAADVNAQFDKYFEANDPDTGGSFYVQSKIHNAREVLLEELRAEKKGAPLK
jgi:import inner membrane translocase subunit TIM16